MPSQGRRDILKKSGIALASTSIIAGCTGSSDDSSGETPTPDGGDGSPSTDTSMPEQMSMRVAAPIATPNDIHGWYGFREVASDQFNLDCTAAAMSSGDLMLQATLSGQIQGFRTGPERIFQIVAQGKPFRQILTDNASTDYVMVGRPEFETIQDVVEKDATIGMASNLSGGPTLQGLALMIQEGVIDSIDEVADQHVAVGYSSSRMTALINGDIDVSPQHWSQWLQIKNENPEFNLISRYAEDLEAWAVMGWNVPEWSIEENRDKWLALVKGILVARDELINDFELYKQKVNLYVEGGGPNDEILRSMWNFIQETNLWPEDGGLEPSTVDFMIDMMVRVGLLDQRIPAEDIIDRTILDQALEELDR